MCGIAGALGRKRSARLISIVHDLVDAQRHRGPDHQQVATVEAGAWTVVLGHDRLSIIDLDPAANQPMWDHSGRYAIVYNGEIYNYLELRAELQRLGHRFRTASDTEVILESFKAWGTDAFPRFNGMFAFALLDREEPRFWLVRDRFGVKPLYYHDAFGTLTFASTMRALAREHGLAPNLAYCACGLQYFVYDRGDGSSAYEGLQAVLPGHFIAFDLSGVGLQGKSQRYYDLAERVRETRRAIEGKSDAELIRTVRELLADAVRLRLRSDVPLAISLSGGLDSASVAALMSELHPAVTGFSFGHPDAAESEGPLVAVLARARGIRVHYVWPTLAEIVESFAETLRCQDGPFAGGSLIAQNLVYAAAKRRGFKVILGGQGGDEAFMGYRKYQLFHLKHLIGSNALASGAFALSLLPSILSEKLALVDYWKHRSRYTRNRGLGSVLQLPSEAVRMGAPGGEEEWLRQWRDVTELSLPTLLRYEDRNSMAHSIESRLPFMDFRVVELGLALPASLKLRNGYGKWIVRAAMRGKVPDAIRLARFKKGFRIEQERWIREGLGSYLRAELARVWPAVEEWVRPEFRYAGIQSVFSDDRLAGAVNAFGEAVTLVWLGDSAARSSTTRAA